MFSHAYTVFSYVVSALVLVYLVYQSVLAQRKKPALTEADILYQEWFASGHSEANLLTKFGGAHNCLRLIVTTEFLIVTSWFPFVLFTAFYDLEHVIPIKSISSVERKRTLGMDYLLLTYQDGQGRSHGIGLTPKYAQGFLAAVGRNADLTALYQDDASR